MRSAPAKIPFPCWSQSWVSLRTAFGPCSAAGSAHELLALLRPHHHLLYPPCFPQSRHRARDFCVFAGDWHECFSGLEAINLLNCKTDLKTRLTGTTLAADGRQFCQDSNSVSVGADGFAMQWHSASLEKSCKANGLAARQIAPVQGGS